MDRKTKYKWFWVWDFEKEEAWLNEEASAGWTLEKVAWAKYQFVKTEPEEYTIRLEMHKCDKSYIDFMKETGAEYIGQVTSWVYFKKRCDKGEFDIFSDIDSRIHHLEKIGNSLFVIGIANLILGVSVSAGMNSVHMGWVNLLCATLMMYALGRIQGKQEALEKERAIHE